jgi:dipeptide/tripeptide permease
MKSVMQSAWLLTVAFGNLIVVIIAEAKFFEEQVLEIQILAIKFEIFYIIIIFQILVQGILFICWFDVCGYANLCIHGLPVYTSSIGGSKEKER